MMKPNIPHNPFGMLMQERTFSSAAYKYGFNGKEKDNEINVDGGNYDFGERIYDGRLGRWLSEDALAVKYPDVSPFVFTLNSPIMAKDPDGNVVIFINGQHAGNGGSAEYWGEYDLAVKKAIGDNSSRYVDGALGGWVNTGVSAAAGAVEGAEGGIAGALFMSVVSVATTSNVNRGVRIAAGQVQGMKDASDIIANLKEGETIKIITHSMGTAFARGYTEGIMAYAKANGLVEKVVFEYELDVNAFQGAELPKDPNIKQSQNKTGGQDGGNSFSELIKGNSVPTVAPVPGATDFHDPVDEGKGHDISKMSTSNIPYLGNGGNGGVVQQGSNNEIQNNETKK